MDPFTALSLAGLVVQFVEFGFKLTAKGSEIYNSISGQTDAVQQVNIITTDLGRFSEKLSQRSATSFYTEAEEDIAALARHCAEEARKLMLILNKLTLVEAGKDDGKTVDEDGSVDTSSKTMSAAEKTKQYLGGLKKSAKEKKRMMDALLPALKSLWKQEEIQEMHKRLSSYQAQITLRLVALTNDNSSSMRILLQGIVEQNSAFQLDTSAQLRELNATMKQVNDIVRLASEPSDKGFSTITPVRGKLESLVNLGDSAIKTIQRSLRFTTMSIREASVVEAHTQTFEWLFSEQSNFSQWLSSYEGIFWVSGKPGSGKSTLMKFVASHTRTRAALRSWAGDKLLITGRFYFWNAGTDMQKSLQGLLQSLLFEIMDQCPLLIPTLAPQRWGNAFNTESRDPWTWDEVMGALSRFMQQEQVDCKTCLFIDGLDEFAGDPIEVVSLLLKLAKSPRIKLCLSSRPHNVFKQAFGISQERMIRLQDLTRDDIRKYAHDKLQIYCADLGLGPLTSEHDSILKEIVNRADGVFLWVYFVVRSLRHGLANADTPAAMHRRVQSLPSDLEEYFAYILQTVEEMYWEETTKCFQMATSALYQLPVGVLGVLDETDTDACLSANVEVISVMQYESRVDILNRRLDARCKGLLEVRTTPGSLYGSNGYSGRHTVDFLHRTVRDYLRIESVDKILRSRLTVPFDVDLTLCRGFLIQLKQYLLADEARICRKLTIEKALEDLIYYSHRSGVIKGIAHVTILDAAFRAVMDARLLDSTACRTLFYSTIIHHGLSQYLEYRLQSDSHYPQYIGDQPLLAVALGSWQPLPSHARFDYARNHAVIQVLLDHDADPNEEYPKQSQQKTKNSSVSKATVWSNFIASLPNIRTADSSITTATSYAEALSILLKGGAHRGDNVKRAIQDKFPAREARSLSCLIEELDNKKMGETTAALTTEARNKQHSTPPPQREPKPITDARNVNKSGEGRKRSRWLSAILSRHSH